MGKVRGSWPPVCTLNVCTVVGCENAHRSTAIVQPVGALRRLSDERLVELAVEVRS